MEVCAREEPDYERLELQYPRGALVLGALTSIVVRTVHADLLVSEQFSFRRRRMVNLVFDGCIRRRISPSKLHIHITEFSPNICIDRLSSRS